MIWIDHSTIAALSAGSACLGLPIGNMLCRRFRNHERVKLQGHMCLVWSISCSANKIFGLSRYFVTSVMLSSCNMSIGNQQRKPSDLPKYRLVAMVQIILRTGALWAGARPRWYPTHKTLRNPALTSLVGRRHTSIHTLSERPHSTRNIDGKPEVESTVQYITFVADDGRADM